MQHRRIVLVGMLVALVCSLNSPAVAQEPKVEIGIGYAWQDDQGFRYPVGWTGSAAILRNAVAGSCRRGGRKLSPRPCPGLAGLHVPG